MLHPLRIEVLKRLAEPRSCPELARELGETTQKQIALRNREDRAGFLSELTGLVQGLARRYGSPDEDPESGESFQVSLVCYPKSTHREERTKS